MNVFAANESLGSRAPLAGAEELRADEVAVWQASLDAEADTVRFLQTVLSVDEAERANRFTFARDRRRFIVGRGILRVLLGDYLGVAPGTLAFRYGANGKPALAAGPRQAPLQFNLAHSDAVALYAFARAGEVGIDVERIRAMADWARVGERSFPPAEFARVQAAPEAERMNAFFRAWTRQEAILKALGVGLGGGAPDSADLRVHSLQPASGFAGALAVGRDVRRLRMHVWTPASAHNLFVTRPDLS